MEKRTSYATFPRSEYSDRLEKARKLMSARNMDALIVTDVSNVTYFSGYPTIRPGEGCAIFPLEEEPTLVASVSESGNIEKTCWFKDVRYYRRMEFDPWAGSDVPNESTSIMRERIKELGAKKIGTTTGFEAVKWKLTNFTEVDATDLIWKLRMLKSNLEIKVLRKVCKATCDAIKASFESLRQGMSERELVKIVYMNLVEKSGGYPPAFALVRSGPEKARMVNSVVNHKILKKGELLILDAGATYQEYTGDTLRMACIGKPNEKQKKFFEIALDSQQTAIERTKPGIRACDIFNAANAIFEKAGIKKDAVLGLCGHGLGVGGYNSPMLADSDKTIVKENMVLNIEPQCWDAPYMAKPTINAVIEDTVLVTKRGCEFLTDAETRDLFILK